jgi:hypothetical protein
MDYLLGLLEIWVFSRYLPKFANTDRPLDSNESV